ncbi:VOC family protein [Breoghania sp. L-A4]|uniref:VOC family protein n=1 Tax=Breoghania sp. L-A4 TaxID=2304600 RepID=UPI000E35A6BB|nr:VOC family protein [Breoghania sp. L-A4]AXS42742.1 VOC family protein [Breoghania sp. L-A4]
MRATGLNHLSIGATDLDASLRFYEEVLGMERIPTYNFGFRTQYLRLGDLQLHVFELEDVVPAFQHFAIDVDDFHAVYDKAKELGLLDGTTFRNAINELPDGAVQMYLRDPGGNLVEIDWPDVTTLDRARIPEMRPLADFAPQEGEALKASLYFDRPERRGAKA